MRLLFFCILFTYCFAKDDEIYPCPDLDVECIRKFFNDRVGCSPRPCEYPNRLDIASHNLFIPLSNMSDVQSPLVVTGLDQGVITHFSHTKCDDLIILTVSFPSVVLNGTNYFRYYNEASRPVVVTSDSSEFYESLTLTTVFKGVRNPQLSQSSSHVVVKGRYSNDFGAGVKEIEDPETAAAFKMLKDNIFFGVLECLFTRSILFANYFIQNHICDYGLDYTYVNYDAQAQI